MRLRKLAVEEHIKTRKLWEEVFSEDTEAFLDYYYTYIAQENEIYVIEDAERIVSMLHLNPYDMRIGESIYRIHYIVAVATDAAYRGRGLMRQLLTHAMTEMYLRKEPFTFLMPAAEAIYRPYDFRYIYEQERGVIVSENMQMPGVRIQDATEDDCIKIAEFANEMLKKQQVVVRRDAKYYARMIREQQSEQGQVVMIFRKEELRGVFFYAKGEQIEIREPIFVEEAEWKQAVYLLIEKEGVPVKCHGFGAGKHPIIMARILDMETMLKNIPLTKDIDMYIQVKDTYLPRNDGVFHIKGTKVAGIELVDRVDDTSVVCEEVKIAELTQQVFAKAFPQVFINEVV